MNEQKPINLAMAIYPIVVVFMLIGLAICLSAWFVRVPEQQPTPIAQPAPQVAPSCKTDWTLCADNADMANHYDGWSHDARVDCKIAAKHAARYGTPEFSAPNFAAYLPGDDYKSGIVTVIDNGGQYSNAFGAMVHARTTCTYDLRQRSVIDIKIEPR
jgi:hypothetical protein